MNTHRSLTYKRVLPRDLFNEAKLLKCAGKLVLLIEDHMAPPNLSYEYDTKQTDNFICGQDESNGAFFIKNVTFKLTDRLFDLVVYQNRNMNWNAYALYPDYTEIPVFNEKGDLTTDFIEHCIEVAHDGS